LSDAVKAYWDPWIVLPSGVFIWRPDRFPLHVNWTALPTTASFGPNKDILGGAK